MIPVAGGVLLLGSHECGVIAEEQHRCRCGAWTRWFTNREGQTGCPSCLTKETPHVLPELD